MSTETQDAVEAVEEINAEVEAQPTPTEKKDRAASLQATRQTKMDELFKGKKFRVSEEVHLEGDDRFETPFGNKGRHGFILEEVGNETNKFIVGETMLNQVSETYGEVENRPVKERKRRTKEQKAADDARAAEEKAAKAAAKQAEKDGE